MSDKKENAPKQEPEDEIKMSGEIDDLNSDQTPAHKQEEIALPRKGTQILKALEILTKARGEWVGVWAIAQYMKSGCARNPIGDARGYGAHIVNRQYYDDQGFKHSDYALVNWDHFKPLLDQDHE